MNLLKLHKFKNFYSPREQLFFYLLLLTTLLAIWHLWGNITQEKLSETIQKRTKVTVDLLNDFLDFQKFKAQTLVKKIIINRIEWSNVGDLIVNDPVIKHLILFDKKTGDIIQNTSQNAEFNQVLNKFLHKKKSEVMIFYKGYCYLYSIDVKNGLSVGVIFDISEIIDNSNQQLSEQNNTINFTSGLEKEQFYNFIKSYELAKYHKKFELLVMWLMLIFSLFLVYVYRVKSLSTKDNLVKLSNALRENEIKTQKLKSVADFDQLTGLGSRNKLYYDFNELKKCAFVMCLMDLDGFKNVNDTSGHLAGDILLKTLSSKIQKIIQMLTYPIYCYRLGGDEFVFISHNTSHMLALTECIYDLFNKKNNIKNISHVTASIGMTMYPKCGHNMTELLSSADLAMYQAKKSGKNQLVQFKTDMKMNVFKKLKYRSDIRLAAETNSFFNYYQPRICVRESKITCIEALARWNYGGQIITPLVFTNNEDYPANSILKIGLQLMEKALSDYKIINNQHCEVNMAINLLPVQLLSQKYMKECIKLIDHYGFSYDQIELEISEKTFSSREKEAISMINKLRAMGFHLSLDDFGKEYSSLTYLKNLPIKIIKIDKSFLDNVPHNSNDIKYLLNIITFIKSLNKIVIVEGVENSQQYKILADSNVDQIQGYLVSRPLSAEDTVKKINSINCHSRLDFLELDESHS